MSNRDLALLVPSVRESLYFMKEAADDVGLNFAVTCTARQFVEQSALYAQGRWPLKEVNMMRLHAMMAPITERENSYCVTWTLDSEHVTGVKRKLSNAFDIVIVKPNGLITWDIKASINDNDIPDYTELGIIGERCGLVWGGRFKNKRTGKLEPDRVHFQGV